MSKLSTPVLALGAYVIVFALVVWHPGGNERPPVDAGAQMRCAPNTRLIDGVCSAESEPQTPSAPSLRTPRPAATVAPRQPAAPVDPTESCHAIAEGALKGGSVFGDAAASHVYASYRLSDMAERDVVLPAGAWQADAQVRSGRFWVYAGCSDEEIAKKVAVRRMTVNRDDPGAHAGQGDGRLFSHVAGTTLGPPVVQRLD